MPFKSEAQRRFMYSQHPELAEEFEKATPEGKHLPEHVPQQMDEGGLVSMVRHAILGDKGEQTVKTDANDARAADAIDPVVATQSGGVASQEDQAHMQAGLPTQAEQARMAALQAQATTGNGYAKGGEVDKDEPGLKDASVSDFLLPFMLAPALKAGAEGVAPALEGLGESGEIAMGRSAPAMEDAVAGATTKDVPGQVEVYVKGVQKGAPGGSGDVKIYGVKGDPAKLKELFGDEAPGSVPEHILQQKGLLPQSGPSVPQPSPNSYADGGKVERSSLAHPVPNAMMARAMSEGGYPHVTFMENETPEQVKETVHLAHGPQMSEGGKTPHFLEGLKKGALPEEMGVPEGDKIPAKKLDKAADSDDETLRKRAQFAINAKKWHHADGGIIEGLKRDKEPAKPANIEPSHEEKLQSIYKAMGVKHFDDGGVSNSDDTIDVSQLPGQGTTTPSSNDPGFWDSIKAALTKLGSPVESAANAAIKPAEAIQPAVAAASPAVTGALNSLTGSNLPVPPAPAMPAPNAAPTAPLVVPTAMPPAGVPMPMSATAPISSPTPDLKGLFNQDTSKVTAGYEPEDRQALATKMAGQQHGLGSIIAEAMAGIGDALAAKGGRDQHSLQNIFSMQKDQRQEALANFDQARQDRLQKLDIQTKLGNNALQGLAAQDAYGTDENLNKMLGAPPRTAHKDLPLYFQAKSAAVAQQEKDTDLYMKAHGQAATDVDNAVKNASVLGVKPSAAQLQASGAKLADQYYNRAKGNILVKPSDGSAAQWIPASNIGKAKQMDPNLQVIPG